MRREDKSDSGVRQSCYSCHVVNVEPGRWISLKQPHFSRFTFDNLTAGIAFEQKQHAHHHAIIEDFGHERSRIKLCFLTTSAFASIPSLTFAAHHLGMAADYRRAQGHREVVSQIYRE